MSAQGPSQAQLIAQVAALRRRKPNAKAYGIHLSGSWTGGDAVELDGDRLPVAVCTTPLEVSVALAECPEDSAIVVLSSVDERHLSHDVLARLADRRLTRIDVWAMVKDAFRCRQIDPRIVTQSWVAEALLRGAPTTGYPPVASGLLDLDTAWQHLLGQYLAMETGRPDPTVLVTWSLAPLNLQRFERLSGPFRAALGQRVAATAGETGSTMFEAITASHGALLLPIGLACEVLFAPDVVADPTIVQAVVRLEPFVGGRTLSSAVGRAWFAAARAALDTLPSDEARQWIDQAERLVREIKAASAVAHSSILPSGYHVRVKAFAASLQAFAEGKASSAMLEDQATEVARHRVASTQNERLERIQMAVRLARFLDMAKTLPVADSLSDAAQQYQSTGGFVDWARTQLLGGDDDADLSAAFASLAAKVREHRETENRRFATLLVEWNKTPTFAKGLLPIEGILDQVVAKAAIQEPVLLVVMDGMGHAVYRELCESMQQHGWVEICPTDEASPPCVISMLPSVTELSRASLLAGSQTKGASAQEKKRFEAHPGLRAASPAAPPVLFHKGDIKDETDSGLASEVRAALQDKKRRVVGVVLNAVDDHLAKSDQVRAHWNLDTLKHLSILLYEARLADRVVILTSDHGHVVEDGTTGIDGDAEERWRQAQGEPGEAELLIQGPRIKAVLGSPAIIAPWSETVRYSKRKNGYHGGASPQEVMVPLGVFVTSDRLLKPGGDAAIPGWRPLPEQKPAWWMPIETITTTPAPVPAKVASKRSVAAAEIASLPLFANLEEPAAPAEKPAQLPWIRALLESEVYLAQRRLAAKLAPDDHVVEQVLVTLDQRGGTAPKKVLAQQLGQPEFRLRGLLASLQRVLNVDGYLVVSSDEAAGSVTLDRPLLNRQFQLP